MSKATQHDRDALPIGVAYIYSDGSGGDRPRNASRSRTAAVALAALGIAAVLLVANGGVVRRVFAERSEELGPFYHSVKTHDDVCVGGVSHSGYIGLKGDSEEQPKRSFFWCVGIARRMWFHAEGGAQAV